MRGLARFSREPVRLWSKRLRKAFPRPERKRRSLVAVDVKTEEVLVCRVLWTRNIMQAEAFLRKVLETCMNRPLILVDKESWYPEALRTLGLKWRHVHSGCETA